MWGDPAIGQTLMQCSNERSLDVENVTVAPQGALPLGKKCNAIIRLLAPRRYAWENELASA